MNSMTCSHPDSSDDEDDLPVFLRPGSILVDEDDTCDGQANQDDSTRGYNESVTAVSLTDSMISEHIGSIDIMLLLKDRKGIQKLRDTVTQTMEHENSTDSMESLLVLIDLAIDILSGRHLKIINFAAQNKNISLISPSMPTTATMLGVFVQQEHPVDQIHEEIVVCISRPVNLVHRKIRALYFLILGISFMELYLQINYTGPELSENDLRCLEVADTGRKQSLHQICLDHLECDGDYIYPLCVNPQSLLLARTILSVVADPARGCWIYGIQLSDLGDILKPKSRHGSIRNITEVENVCQSLHSRHWQDARAAVIHLRCLQKQSYANIPTLWKECQDMFSTAIQSMKELHSNIPKLDQSDSFTNYQLQTIHAQVWLEWGLCNHYFEFGDRGKGYFAKAKEIAGLQTELTAALGRRTKYQHTDYAQLFLYARSSLFDENILVAAPHDKAGSYTLKEKINYYPEPETTTEETLKEAVEESPKEATSSGGWKHAEWELGRRLVGEVNTGEEAAVREVMLDSMDGGPEENILLEGGPKFAQVVDKGDTKLHTVDQAIILALCLDVANSNPQDGLTNEEMYPYIERVLQQPENWMIHSTALLERSWLEYERRKTFDRAMLQIQALLDQHSTKLAISQSTFKSIEESAPVEDRLLCINCIVYPAQYELKRDLAFRYLRSQVFVSALNLFRELELWDEVVQCYQLLEKPQRAELVVRERLKHSETPYMLTALADLTQSDELYEKAWIVSKGRYARAKRTLGRICYDRGDFRDCIRHLDAALGVQPLVATSWYLRGIACMQTEDWDEGIKSFVRCVQQDLEVSEAYANIGAIHMRRQDYQKAYPVLYEAWKHKSDSWKIMENLLTVCLELGKLREMVLYMERLLNLKLKSQRPVHKKELRYLVLTVASEAQADAQLKQKISATDSSEEQCKVEVLELSQLAKAVEELLLKIVNSVRSDGDIWDIFAVFYELLGRRKDVADCRMKQVRALISVPDWEKESASVSVVTEACRSLVLAHRIGLETQRVGKADVYGCRSLLQTVEKKVEVVFKDSDLYRQILDMIVEADILYSTC